jgi:hypothetical protein
MKFILPDPTIDHAPTPVEITEEQCAECGYIGYIAEQSFCRVSKEWYVSKELMVWDGVWRCVEHKNEK